MYGLQLQTSHLNLLQHFYGQILDFPILDETSTYFRTQIGSTILDFEQASEVLALNCFRLGIPIESFNVTMNNLSQRVKIKRRRSVFHDKLKPTWYIRDPSNNIIELGAYEVDESGIVGIVMFVQSTTTVSEQLQALGLTGIFTDPFRCILENPDDATRIVLIQTRVDKNTSMNQAITIPTMKSSINATVCVKDTPHFLYMVTP